MDASKCVFNNSIKYMNELIGKTIEIKTIENITHLGHVYVVDPKSKTLVLTIRDEHKVEMIIIPYHAIKSLSVATRPSCDDLSLANRIEKSVNLEELKQKKAKIKGWLEENLIDVKEEDMTLKIGQHIVMEPPYSAEHIICNNVMVLNRLLELIGKMPVQYKCEEQTMSFEA